jgi:uncharacterized membrane protein
MLEFNFAMNCLFDGWVREMFMREGHFDTAHAVELDACFVQ